MRKLSKVLLVAALVGGVAAGVVAARQRQSAAAPDELRERLARRRPGATAGSPDGASSPRPTPVAQG